MCWCPARGRAHGLLLSEDERLALIEHPRSWIPGYLGPSGWVGLDLDEDTDWDEVAELLEESFRETAPRDLVAQLDPASG